VLHALVARADAFVHSFRPGVDQRLHLDAPTLLQVNPRLVHLYAGSYGSRGPQAHRSAFHSTPTALTGGGILQAGEGNVPVDDSYPDPGSALGAATALLLGLEARDRTGEGQVLETSMLASSAFILSGEMVSYAGKPPWRLPDQGQHGIGERRRLYQGTDGWLFVAAEDDLSWAAVGEVLDGADFADLPVGPTVAALQARGVSATAAADVEIDVWLEREGLLLPAAHPFYGEYWRTRPKIDVEGVDPVFAPPTTVGEHTEALLAELGLVNLL
jgi:crotonobetainyl-CoA:carnitine CoA-transferase CaiB-like acyl-CoA transferase